MKRSILIASQDMEFISSIGNVFLTEGSTIISSSYGNDAIDTFTNNKIDMAFVDILLRDMTGIELVSNLRKKMINIPVIALYRSDMEIDLWDGLKDEIDILVKKDERKNYLEHQLIQCQKKLNRWDIGPASTLGKTVGPFEINNGSGDIWLHHQLLMLTIKQKKLMKHFIDHPNEVLTKQNIIYNVWETKYLSDSTLSVYINGLRKKIEEDPHNPKYLCTEWGVGYYLRIDELL